MEDQRFPFVYDIELKRPACVLIQAVYGARTYPCSKFDPGDWLTAPTPGMQKYNVTMKDIDDMVRVTKMHKDAVNALNSAGSGSNH